MRDSINHIVWRPLLAAALFVAGILSVAAQERHTPRYYASRAEGYVSSNAWEAAKREIDEGLESYPDDPDLRYLNGRYYYYAQGDLTRARYNLVRSIQEDDQHFQAKRVLVDVEDDAKHYSSAICYINELLEFQPYDRDLWRRKIALYNKIGHRTEADAALERLARIFPNDSIVRRDLNNRHREDWNTRLLKPSLSETANTLEEWLDYDPSNLDYYKELAEVYYQMGEYERALGAANRGLARYPREAELVRKAATVLSAMGMITSAVTFVRQNGYTGTLYTGLLADAANDARLRDPYEVNGRLYATTGSRDALTYLLNTALTRGYYNDAKYYLRESYARNGRTLDLLMKEYELEKRFGDERATLRLLQEMYESNPRDEDLTEQYAAMMLELAGRDIAHEQWADASAHLQRAILLLDPENEAWSAAVSQQITMLGRLNRFDDARELYEAASLLGADVAQRFASAYEDVAANRLRALMLEEEYESALKLAQELLLVVPASEPALRCCINVTQTLGYDDLFHEYADRGYAARPDTPYFIIKEAVALQQRGRMAEALALLRPEREGEYHEYVNPQLQAAFSGITEEWAVLLMKEKMPDVALVKLDIALRYDPENRELLYLKGLAHEQLKQFALAWQYQSRNYNPSNAEQLQWYQHMRYMHFRSFRNRVDASYTRAVYDTRQEELASVGHLYSIASVSYSRLEDNDTFTGQISYKGVDGYHTSDVSETGGVGLDFMAQWDHTFNHRWSGSASASYSTRFFNKWGANLSAAYAADGGWTPSLRLGYRRTPPTWLYLDPESGKDADYAKYNLFVLTPSVEKSWETVKTSLGVDLSLMGGNLFYNVGWKGRLFLNDDNISSVSLMAGFGSFPELNFFDQTALRNVSHTNTMIGFDAQYLLTHNLFVSVSGTWNTCYNPIRRNDMIIGASRNIYGINVAMHVAF